MCNKSTIENLKQSMKALLRNHERQFKKCSFEKSTFENSVLNDWDDLL